MKLPKISLTWKIFIGLILGIALGYFSKEWGAAVRPLSLLFLNLIKSIIAPLIFSTLVIGIAGTGDIKQVGRIGIKALFYFEIVTTFALVIGLTAVNLTRPGEGVSLAGVHREDNKAVLAERARFWPSLATSLLLASLLIPTIILWTHAGGWLNNMGFTDQAGAAATKARLASALKIARQTAAPRATMFPVSSPIPMSTARTPTSRCTQPHTV